MRQSPTKVWTRVRKAGIETTVACERIDRNHTYTQYGVVLAAQDIKVTMVAAVESTTVAYKTMDFCLPASEMRWSEV